MLLTNYCTKLIRKDKKERCSNQGVKSPFFFLIINIVTILFEKNLQYKHNVACIYCVTKSQLQNKQILYNNNPEKIRNNFQ